MCVYIPMFTPTYMHVYVHMFVSIYSYIHTGMCVCVHMHIHTTMYTHRDFFQLPLLLIVVTKTLTDTRG